jgi:DNA-binding transcriptional ArsR family regulator
MLNKEMILDRTFQALADASRRSILARLSQGPSSVSELARPLAMSLPAVMQHVSVLEEAGLVRSRKVGRVRTCSIDARALDGAEHWIGLRRNEWQQRFEQLDRHLKIVTKRGTTHGS